MIAYLKGKILEKRISYAIVEVGGIGYQVFATDKYLATLPINQEVAVYVSQIIKEDANDLYGFKSLDELEFFEMLLTVSGIGPKSAMAIMSLAPANELLAGISAGNAEILTRVSGVGKKTAERLVLELRNKVSRLSLSADSLPGVSFAGDEIEALMTLGYSINEAKEALSLVDPEIKDSASRVKAALKLAGRKS